MFSGFMVQTWEVATVVGVVAGVVGFYTVLRGSSFVAHGIPQSAFTGAAGATLIGASQLLGMGVFGLLSALGIGWLARRGRSDVATALTLVVMLGLGGFFLSLTSEYASEVFSLLFGEVLGVSANEVWPTVGLGVAVLAVMVVLARPLLLDSVLDDGGARRQGAALWLEIAFLIVVALATTASVPVVGALLMFSLMIGPPAAARYFTDRPWVALVLSVALALLSVWTAIAASYLSNWPVGFFVGVNGAVLYVVGRGWAAWRGTRVAAHLPEPVAVPVS